MDILKMSKIEKRLPNPELKKTRFFMYIFYLANIYKIEIHNRQPNSNNYNNNMAQFTTITRDMATRLVNKFYKADTSSYDTHTNENIRTREEFVDECLLDEELIPMIHENNNNTLKNKEVYTFLKLIYKILNVVENDIKDNADALSAYVDYCIETLHLCEITLQYLIAANRNYHLLLSKDSRTTGEDLLDMAFEENVCSICLYDNISQTGLKAFYYSTSFGLNMPVCHECVVSGGNEEEEDKKDEDYVPVEADEDEETDEDEEAEAEAEADEDEDEDYNDPDYVPSDNADDDADDDDDDAIIEDTDDIDDIPHTQNSWLPGDNNIIFEDSDSILTQNSNISSNYASGWSDGWNEAMQFIVQQVRRNNRAPALQPCDNCDDNTRKTKKCGGTCNGATRYCSVKCQQAHWNLTHKHDCSKK